MASTFQDSSAGTGVALGVSQTAADLRSGTIKGVTITSSTISGNTQSGGAITSITGLTTTSAATVGMFGVAATSQPASSAQAALTLTTAVASGFGFTSATAFNAFIAQLENIRASLVLLGLLKGTS